MKNLLRDKANFDVLEGPLSTLLEQEIKVLSLLESEANQQHEADKFNLVKNIQQAREKLDLLKMAEADRHAYARYLIERSIEQDVLQTSYSEGERDKARQIARAMLAEGVEPTLIARVTGLSAEEITHVG